jgi:hypothetical protein
MVAMLVVMAFMGGFVAGDMFGSRRWRRAAEEALQLAAEALSQKRSRERA